jgi:hypothetical protein
MRRRLPTITVLLSFYDEPPSRLFDVCVAASTVGTGTIVALDGAYRSLPGGKPRSPSSNHDAINTACRAAGMKLELEIPDEVWAGDELEKRTRLFELGEQHTTENDWYFVLDADTLVTHPIDLQSALAGLKSFDAAEVAVRDGRAKGDRSLRMLFRAARGLEVVGNHYTYVTGDGRYLWGPPTKPVVPAADLSVLEVWHLNPMPGDRNDRQQQYYDHREQNGLEDATCDWCSKKATRLVVLEDGEVKAACRSCAHREAVESQVYS